VSRRMPRPPRLNLVVSVLSAGVCAANGVGADVSRWRSSGELRVRLSVALLCAERPVSAALRLGRALRHN